MDSNKNIRKHIESWWVPVTGYLMAMAFIVFSIYLACLPAPAGQEIFVRFFALVFVILMCGYILAYILFFCLFAISGLVNGPGGSGRDR